MEYNEENSYLMLFGIQHFQFCKRQWEEKVRTIEGEYLHQKADQPFIKEKRGNKLTVRAMPIK